MNIQKTSVALGSTNQNKIKLPLLKKINNLVKNEPEIITASAFTLLSLISPFIKNISSQIKYFICGTCTLTSGAFFVKKLFKECFRDFNIDCRSKL